MKTGSKVLCIIALIIGLIWATVGFFGNWFGGAVSATAKTLTSDAKGAKSTINESVNTMIKHIGSFIVVIIAGVLGIVGSDKKPAKIKPLILGLLTFICGCILFPLNNYIAAILYLVAGILLLLAGITAKKNNENSTVNTTLVNTIF